ncbi:MAG TPA: histidine kinase [Chitinophagaceae bacterium]|nr:histidine kinase [Chitinophagaceae bacterium]
MKQILITVFLFFLLADISIAQPKYTRVYIQQLHHKLKNAKGADRADILNELSYAWYKIVDSTLIRNWADAVKIKGDSVRFYADLAYRESKKLNYTKGKLIASINLAQGIRFQWWDDEGFPKPVVKPIIDSMRVLLDQTEPVLNQINDHLFKAEYYILKGDLILKLDHSDLLNYSRAWQKGISEFELGGEIKDAAEYCTWLSFSYIDGGYLNEALDYSLKGLELSRKWETADTTINTSFETLDWKQYLIKQSLANLATIAKNGGDYFTAMSYLNELNAYQKKSVRPWPVDYEKSELFISMSNVDSALYYQKKVARPIPASFLLARIHMLQNEYIEAIPMLKTAIDSFTKKRNHPEVSTASILLSKATAALGNYDEAFIYSRFSMNVANQWGRRAFMVPIYETLAQIHHKTGNNDSAYYYLNNFIKLKDSIQNSQFLWQLHKTQKEASMALLMKDNQIQASEIRRQAQVRNVLLAALLLLLIAAAFIWRNIILRKKNEQLELMGKQAELQQQAQDLEMKALKAQMNPHFIFNSLSSINWFILKHKTQEASDYLTSFSRLIRMVLSNSEKSLVTLDEELKMLRLYLDMEQLRLEHSFDYRITMMNNIDPTEIYMPPMILQPFCENAIWHGLSHKSEKGMLTVNFELQGVTLNCTIADNGVGREMANMLNNNASHRGKSMGIQITKSRLSLFNGTPNESEYYCIEDVMNEEGLVGGTKVTLKINSKDVA